MINNVYSGVTQQLQGYFKVGVVDPATNEVVKWHSDKWEKNLILNQGMDNLYNSSIVDQILYAVSGVGNRPNSISSQTSQITQSGATIAMIVQTGLSDFTSSAGTTYAAAAQIGDMIVDSDNSQSMITAVNPDGRHLTVTPTSYTYTNPKTFVIWKTSQTGLENEVSRSNAYLAGAGNAGTTVTQNVAVHRRTYDFPIETSPSSYNELGVAWTNTKGAATVFSRFPLGSPVAVSTGYKLRLIYDLTCAWQPTQSLYVTASVGGWPGATYGTESLQNMNTWISYVNTSDGSSNNGQAVMDPYFINNGSIYVSAFISTNSASLNAFGSAVDRSTTGVSGGAMSKASYVNSSFYVDKTATFTPASLGTSTLRSLGLGYYGGGAQAYQSSYQFYCLRLDLPQTKLNTQTLSLTFRQSWARTLA